MPADETDEISIPLPTPDVLPYHTPVPQPPPPSPVTAMLLCLPGAACWAVLIGLIVSSVTRFRFSLLRWVGIDIMILLWFAAVITALISLFSYGGTKKPWYVKLCLTINVTGLLFSAVMLCLGLLAMR